MNQCHIKYHSVIVYHTVCLFCRHVLVFVRPIEITNSDSVSWAMSVITKKMVVSIHLIKCILTLTVSFKQLRPRVYSHAGGAVVL